MMYKSRLFMYNSSIDMRKIAGHVMNNYPVYRRNLQCSVYGTGILWHGCSVMGE